MHRDVSLIVANLNRLIVANLNNRCQLVSNLNRCLADKMSRAVGLVVDHGVGSNVDKWLDDWLGSCGERRCRCVDVRMEHVGKVVTIGMCCGMESMSNQVSAMVSCWVDSVSY